jgi:outer membrane lipoprotein-sorting protein
MRIILSGCLLLCTIFVIAQDKAATKLLDDLASKYDKYSSIEIDFNMDITYADATKESFKGQIIQEGSKFVFIGGAQDIYCDETAVWFHLKSRNEVQINDYDYDPEDLSVITPKDLLKQYQSGKYDYQLLEEDNTKVLIEFKPLDRDSEYAKFKIDIAKKTNQINKVQAFNKDGSTIVISVTGQKTNKKYPISTFAFNPKKYPGIHIEDLRID